MSTNFWNKYYIVSKTHYEFKTTGKLKPTATFVSSILEQYSGTMLIESAEELQFIHMYKWKKIAFLHPGISSIAVLHQFCCLTVPHQSLDFKDEAKLPANN